MGNQCNGSYDAASYIGIDFFYSLVRSSLCYTMSGGSRSCLQTKVTQDPGIPFGYVSSSWIYGCCFYNYKAPCTSYL